MAKRVIVNGKSIILPDGVETVEAARPYLGVAAGDVLMNVRDAAARPLGPKDPLPDGANIAAFGEITKGAAPPAPVARSPWLADLRLLAAAIGGRHAVDAKDVQIDGGAYVAVAIRNARMDQQKFGTTAADLLFLLPPAYPQLPPVGVYLFYPFESRDHHFTLQSFYGAPDLRTKGWYWYCLRRSGGGLWRPAVTPAGGHNLISLFTAARHAVNGD